MSELPKRKQIRIQDYDYSTSGAYFIAVCITDRKPILQITKHYPMMSVDKYCVMPDHIHMILSINTDEDGRQIASPTVSTVVGHMKRWVSMQIGYSIWQKSFIDRVIRNDRGYRAVWEYIENNPTKLDTAYDMPDFESM